MRRKLFLTLGVLETLVALVLLLVVWQLPGPSEVSDGLGRVGQVSTETSDQIKRLQTQLDTLRSRQPQVQDLTRQLREQMTVLSDHLKGQQVDYTTVRAISKAMSDVAQGLDQLSETLAPHGAGQIGTALKAAADYLDDKVVPAATAAAARIEKASTDVQADARRLRKLLREAPVDLRVVREIHDSLGRLGTGLDRVSRLLKVDNMDAIRDGLKGMESSLGTGAEQVERLAGYSYPVVTLDGLKPSVEQKPFWPEGAKIATGMRKAAKGVATANKNLEGITEGLPRVRESLDESRRAAAKTRETLGVVLKHQDKLGPLVENLPEHVTRLAEELPQAGLSLSGMLKEAAKLEDVARALRKAQKGVEAASSAWPQLRNSLGRSATLLRTTQSRLKDALAHEKDYSAALKHTLLVTEAFSAALPLLTEKVDEDLQEQQDSLARLGGSIDNMTAALPAYSQMASRLLLLTRLLLALVAAIFFLHGGHQLYSAHVRTANG